MSSLFHSSLYWAFEFAARSIQVGQPCPSSSLKAEVVGRHPSQVHNAGKGAFSQVRAKRYKGFPVSLQKEM